jgi:predicted dehydrogenase
MMNTRNLTRRSFTAISAAHVLSGAGDKIRAAVVGTGHGHAISKIRALRSMPEYDLVGVCRPDPAEPGNADVVRDVRPLSLQQILDDSSIEMVAIETADFDRNLDYAEQFVNARRFLHFDKPPGADLERLRKLLAKAKEHKRVVQMGYQWRYQSAMQATVEAARKGWLGRVYRFSASIDKLVGPEERRHLAKHRGGLMFSEACHLVDRAVAVLGKPRKVTSILRHDSTMNDGLADNTLAILEYDHAIAEISMAGFRANGTPYRFLEILGTNGSIRAQPYAYPSRVMVDFIEAAGSYKAGVQVFEPPPPPGLAYTPDFREMAAVIRTGAAPSHSPEHDLVTHETLLRICGMLSS